MSGRSCSAACAVFFLRVIAWRATDRAVANRRALFCERLSQFLDRDVGRFFDEFEDRVLIEPRSGLHLRTSARFALSRSTARQRLTLAALTPNRSPACRWLTPLRHRGQHTSRRSSDRALGRSAHLIPADSLNHLNADSGIPYDSFRSTNALMLPLSPCGLVGELSVSRAVPRPCAGID